jgi:hypothetical protein
MTMLERRIRSSRAGGSVGIRPADESGKRSKRETGDEAPSTKPPVQFTYRLG